MWCALRRVVPKFVIRFRFRFITPTSQLCAPVLSSYSVPLRFCGSLILLVVRLYHFQSLSLLPVVLAMFPNLTLMN
jgi:hypothetical protein